MNWVPLLLESYNIATQSEDPSTQNGAILVNDSGEILTTAFNRFPLGVKSTPERWNTKPMKYQLVSHAEAGVVYAAAKKGIRTEGTTLVCGWASCTNCAKAMIDAGVKRLVTHKQAADRSPPMWRDEVAIAMIMFEEAGVEVIMYDGNVDGPELRHTGEVWVP